MEGDDQDIAGDAVRALVDGQCPRWAHRRLGRVGAGEATMCCTPGSVLGHLTSWESKTPFTDMPPMAGPAKKKTDFGSSS